MKYKAAAISDVGNIRKRNEDSVLLCKKKIGRKELVLAVVADGMGGLRYGGFASRSLVEGLFEYWERFEWLKFDKSSLPQICRELREQIDIVQEKLVTISREEQARMGTTVSLLVLWEGEYRIMQVGDSRIYRLDDKGIYQLTKDQTWCQREVDNGNLLPEEIETHPKRHMLINALGIDGNFFVVTTEGRLKKGERLLLCSDGFYMYLNDVELAPGKSAKEPKEVLDTALRVIKAGTAEDNCSAVLIQA